MTRKYVVTLEDTLKGWQEDEDELERKYGAEPLNCGNCEIVQASINTGIKTASRLVDDVLEQIKAEIEKEYKWLMQTKHTLCDIDIAFSGIKSAIDKHISGKENE